MAQRVMRIVVPIVLVAPVVVAVFFYSARGALNDREKIYRNLTTAERAVESSSVSDIMALVSEDYEDEYGNTKNTLTRLLLGALRQEAWEVNVQLEDLTIEDSTATSSLRVGIWPVDSPQSRRVYDVTIQWQRADGRWRAVSSSGWSDAQSDFML